MKDEEVKVTEKVEESYQQEKDKRKALEEAEQNAFSRKVRTFEEDIEKT